MKSLHYTIERNVQIVIALLKSHGIRKVIASPGTTNMTFVGSIQQDKWFEIYSCVDERSAAYIACGMSAECGEPVVLSCTGATASRNYMSGLTEAYYRKLPILAITSHRGNQQIGHLHDQQIDRRVIPNDIAIESVTIPMIKSSKDERFCEIEANRAILSLKLNGGGPVHINMFTEYNRDFSIKEIPYVHTIQRYYFYDKLPPLPKVNHIGVYIGSHSNFSLEETIALERFCETNNAVVFCDHTSGYLGKYQVRFHIINVQTIKDDSARTLDLMIHIGEVSGTYHVTPKEVWRLSEDGQLRDTFGKLTKVFMMPEKYFFEKYTKDNNVPMLYLKKCEEEYNKIMAQIPDLPFGNIWIAQQTANKLPKGSELHMGIYNSLRSWNFFKLPENVSGKCNVGGFGIDGCLSSLIGASIAKPDKLFYGVFGDLAFFYDINVLGNRHIDRNIRIMLINNGQGGEFRLHSHPCSIFEDDAEKYMSAAGHFGNKSTELVKNYSENLGFEYHSIHSKEEYLKILDYFVSPILTEKPILIEIFTKTEDESDALDLISNIYNDNKSKCKNKIIKIMKMAIGEKGIEITKQIKNKF